MNYTFLREFADSYALGAMVIAYLILTGWAFRPGSRVRNDDAARVIFAEDTEIVSKNGDANDG